jgi:hypothetical protein
MSKSSIRIGVGLAGAAFLTLVVAVTVAIADAEPKPVAGISNIMIAVNDETHGMFGQIEKFLATNPGKDKADEWKVMRHRAQIMAECGNVLMAKSPPRGADDAAGIAKWKQHCADFRDCCKKLSKSLAMKNVAKAQAAAKVVKQRCDSCHDDHKSK